MENPEKRATPAPGSALARFERSMEMDYMKWHDGIGYDLEALRAASPDDRAVIENLLAHHTPRDWRDIEALALLDTPRAREAIVAAMHEGGADVRAAVMRCAPQLVSHAQHAASVVKALQDAKFYEGLTQVLDEVAEFHPPEVVEALLQGTVARDGATAVHFAAMLAFIHGKTKEPFDCAHRPFFLRFNTEDRNERQAALRELCAWLGLPPVGS